MIDHIYLPVVKSLVRNQIPNRKIPEGKCVPFYNMASRNTFKPKKGLTYNLI